MKHGYLRLRDEKRWNEMINEVIDLDQVQIGYQ
jgi:hypothetical protein